MIYNDFFSQSNPNLISSAITLHLEKLINNTETKIPI